MIRASLFALALLAAACTPPADTPPEEPVVETPVAPTTAAEATARDTCGGAQYRTLIGTNFAAVTLPADSGIRIIQPDTAVTDDFRPDRINIIVDAGGIITAVECY
ncbi:MAG: serine protease inhibitor [Hyphomonadaceae bacterium]|nr:serine protease inhibitor [Hyphomonadaceae bacterium]